MSTVALESLGCKLNQAEIESLTRQLLGIGWQAVESPVEADAYVLNSCTVTHIADRKARHRVRWVRRNNPETFIAVIGCYAERSPEALVQAGADLVLGNGGKELLPQLLKAEIKKRNCCTNTHSQGDRTGRTRALVKIQEGCRDSCSFCIVPLVRGVSRNISPDQVVKEVEERVHEGYREVVLTGTEPGAYRWRGRMRLFHLVKRVLDETSVERLRLSSIQPQQLYSELLGLWIDKRLCNHVHIPLQSGSDVTLRRMRRRYSVAEFERSVVAVRDAIPDVSITTDIIVGFPGETERDFEESYHFCERMGFAKIHVFPYSPRPGTEAADMPCQIEVSVKKERVNRMLSLSQRSAHIFVQRFHGRIMQVLWEGEVDEGEWSGLTPNYIRVFANGIPSQGSERYLANECLPTMLVCDEGGEGLRAEFNKSGVGNE